MALTPYNIKKWTRMLLGKSDLHVHQGVGQCMSPDSRRGYYNDLTLKITQFHLPHNTIPRHPIGPDGTLTYFPIGIFQHGLASYDLYLLTHDEAYLNDTLLCAQWAIANQLPNGAWDTFGTLYPQAPFSAMAQGQAISLLARAYAATQDTTFLTPIPQAYAFLRTNTTQADGILLEYTHKPPVLNGWIFALWGIWDMQYLPIDKADSRQFLDTTIATLVATLPRFDIGFWTNYNLDGTIQASTHYQRIHIAQMQAMHALTRNEIFRDYALRWQRQLDSPLNRLRAFLRKAVQKLREKA